MSTGGVEFLCGVYVSVCWSTYVCAMYMGGRGCRIVWAVVVCLWRRAEVLIFTHTYACMYV